MTIKYSETFGIVTPESAKRGEYEREGFIGADLECSFFEMIELLRGTEPSISPLEESAAGDTFYTRYMYNEGSLEWWEGEEESRSYHPSTERDGRYMLKA